MYMIEDIWTDLVSEGNFDLISKLRRAELGEPGFGTIVVTREGFSDDDRVHNKVLRWLKGKKIHILDIMFEIGNLEVIIREMKKRRRKSSKKQ